MLKGLNEQFCKWKDPVLDKKQDRIFFRAQNHKQDLQKRVGWNKINLTGGIGMKKPILIEDLCDYRYLSSVELNESGTLAVFAVSQGEMEQNTYHHYLACYDFATGQVRPLTASKEERSFLWEDDKTLLFPADRDGAVKKAREQGKKLTSYYRLSLNGGEALKAFSLPFNVVSLTLVDAESVLVVAQDDLTEINLDGLSAEELERKKKEREEEKDYEVLDELPYWFNGRGFINKLRKRLYLFNLQTKKVQRFSSQWMDVQQVLLHENKKKCIVIGAEYDSINSQFSKIVEIDLADGQSRILLEEGKLAVRNAALLHDVLVFTGTDYKTWGSSENAKFYRLDLNNGALACFLDQDLSIGSSVGSDAKMFGGTSFTAENERIYLTLTVDNCSNIYSVDLNGTLQQLTFEEGSTDCFSVKKDRLVFIGMRQLKLQELYEVKAGKEAVLTTINTALQEKEVLPLNKLSFVDSDGVRIDGWVIEPRGYDPKQTYPAVLDIHGGPKTVYGETFFHEMQVWASMGYFVFFCNPRGSDGRGNAFMNLVNRYGTVDYQDLMEFTDEVLKKYPAIDSSKIAVTGGSYGGFMTNWIIGHTDRFCCAASQRSIANWVSKALTTDIGYYHNMSQMASTPWTDIDRMWGFSPLKYADRCVTPTLFIQSDEDYRCWMADALQMFQALKLHHVPTRMCLFHHENHELSRSGKPKHRRRRLKEITDWFEKYCR